MCAHAEVIVSVKKRETLLGLWTLHRHWFQSHMIQSRFMRRQKQIKP
jgi:hypothetical protein